MVAFNKGIGEFAWKSDQKLINCIIIFDWNLKQTLLYLYWMLPKSPIYTFIQAYMFISFQEKVPPIRLFPPILLLFLREISHLYFYSDSSSIRNSRVVTFGQKSRPVYYSRLYGTLNLRNLKYLSLSKSFCWKLKEARRTKLGQKILAKNSK